MKLLYDCAFALQILLPKQIKEEKMRTGRLPKHVWIGTLGIMSNELLRLNVARLTK